MKNRKASKGRSRSLVAMAFLIFTSPVRSGRCEGEKGSDAAPFTFAPDQRGSFIQEAARAVMGRVFGVKGEAANIDYHVVELTGRSPVNASIRSALVPGWGQHFNRQRVKGTLFFLTVTAAGVGAILRYNDSKDSIDEYESRGVKDSSLFEDYEGQRSQAMILAGAAAFLWGLSVIDAYRNAYNPLFSKRIPFEVAYKDHESFIKYRKKF